METLAKSQKKELSESESCGSMTESKESSRTSTSCDSDSVSEHSLSAEFVKDDVSEGKIKTHKNDDEVELKKRRARFSELEMMKERFAKLLLGEDMSGTGNGVSQALAISNAITNLCATVFGQLSRLEPLPSEKKNMWKREMEWLVSVSDHIVEFIPSWQTFPDGAKREVMTCRPRSDLYINLPALRKLDNILLEIIDGFTDTEFWYVDQGVIAPEANGSASFQKLIQRQKDKWWLPVPRVPSGGLPEKTRKQLVYKRDCANQILKAAMAINSVSLAEMEVPESYLETLPKNGKACLGDVIYRYITSEHFSSECLLDCLDLSSEHVALELANRVEAAIYVLTRRQLHKPSTHPNRTSGKSSWEIVKDLMIDDKRELIAERAETLLLCLKQRFPCLTQTTLDASKIQYNKDIGKSILESYSRVLESLAFNIVSRIDDLLFVDDINNQSGRLSSVSMAAHKKVNNPYSVSLSGTPYRTAFNTPDFSPARSERSPFLGGGCNKTGQYRGIGVKRVLTNYLGNDIMTKNCGNVVEGNE